MSLLGRAGATISLAGAGLLAGCGGGDSDTTPIAAPAETAGEIDPTTTPLTPEQMDDVTTTISEEIRDDVALRV